MVTLSFDHAPRLGQIPLWLTGTIIGRDLLLGIGAVVVRAVVGTITVRPRLTGKVATVFQMIIVLWILIGWDEYFHGHLLKVWFLGAGLFTGVSGVFYVWDGTQQLGGHPSSSAIRLDRDAP